MRRHLVPHRIILSLLLFIIFPVQSAEKTRPLNSLEKMLAGFSTCDLPGVYIDWQTQRAEHPYLRFLMSRGMKIEDSFAHFNRINLTFHGLRVIKLTVPANTFTAHRLVLDAPYLKAKSLLEPALNINLPQTSPLPKNSDEYVPILLPHPENPKWSILECISGI